jgi:hypothetical protein
MFSSPSPRAGGPFWVSGNISRSAVVHTGEVIYEVCKTDCGKWGCFAVCGLKAILGLTSVRRNSRQA